MTEWKTRVNKQGFREVERVPIFLEKEVNEFLYKAIVLMLKLISNPINWLLKNKFEEI